MRDREIQLPMMSCRIFTFIFKSAYIRTDLNFFFTKYEFPLNNKLNVCNILWLQSKIEKVKQINCQNFENFVWFIIIK